MNPIRSTFRTLFATLVLLLAACSQPAAPTSEEPTVRAMAAFSVTKTADTNDGACNADCSLREAIIAANAAAGADTISLPAGTYTLTRAGVDNTAASGDLDVTDALTISGAGQGSTIIEAGSSGPTAIDRIFSFNPLGTAAGFAVSLSNLTLRHGRNTNAFATQENDGGCFDFDGGTAGTGSLGLSNVTVNNCETTDGSGGGAAIFLPKGGTVNISGSTIQNNIASRGGTNSGSGGGLIVACVQSGGTSSITISNTAILSNSTRSLGGYNIGDGGGVVFFGACTPGTATSNMQLHAVNISNNSAGNDGGGIFSGGALTIDNVGGPSLISNNSAGRAGGGIWLNHFNTTSNISKVTFSGNSAGDAGGAIRLGSATGNVLNVSFSRFVGNTAASGRASALSVYNGNATATHNWWGCSSGPSAAPCDTAKLDPASGTTGPLGTGTLNFTPWLRLNLSATTNPLVVGQSTGLSASFLTDSNGGAVALGNLSVLLGLPVSWSAVGGNLSGQQTTIQAAGTATANYQATAAAAGNRAVAKVDNDSTTAGSNGLNLSVNKANTTTSITADTPDPSAPGQAVTINYSVSAIAPGSGTPTGNVTVSDGTQSCTATVAAGGCSISFSGQGAKTLTATYAGDASYNGSTSAGVPHTVSSPATTSSITSHTPNPSVVGQAVAVQYSVTASAGTPSGNVTVSDGTVSCTATVGAGGCSLTFSSAGTKSLTATYAGDATFSGSTSTVEAHTVNPANTTTTISTHTPDPSKLGQAVNVQFNVGVNAPGAGTPTGNVTVSDGVDSCSAAVSAGGCSLNLNTNGVRTLTATYAGDANFASSTSSGVAHTVDGLAPSLTINQAAGQSDPTNASPINFTATFSEAVSGFDPNDIVISGSAGATTAVVTGGPLSYNVAISGMTGSGSVIVNIPAGAATDAAGNPSTASTSTDNSVTYQAGGSYTFSGFFQPVDALPTLNQVKAGQSIPIKFSLSGNQGLNILASGSPASGAIACNSSTPVDDVEETSTAGNSTLQYDPTSDTYTYIWKTEKGWSGSCRQLVLTLADGMSYKANFKFK